MKKITFLMVGLMVLSANVFAANYGDITKFVGTWIDASNGKEIQIEYQNSLGGRLKITGIFTPDHVIFSRGEDIVRGTPVIYSSGTYGDDVFIIAVLDRVSLSDGPFPKYDVPDLYNQFLLKLSNDLKTLNLQRVFFEYEPEHKDVVFYPKFSVFKKKE